MYKTVRHYVREGQLKATRIGKQYRIARADLEAFTGHPAPPSASEVAKRQRHIEVSALVQVDAISPEAATQLGSALAAFVSGRAKPEDPVRVDSIYDQLTGQMKIILHGGTNEAAAALKLITAVFG